MPTEFITKVRDPHHRITIDYDAWEKEKLELGEYVRVTVEKVKKLY